MSELEQSFEIQIVHAVRNNERSLEILAQGLDELKKESIQRTSRIQEEIDGSLEKIQGVQIEMQHVAKRSDISDLIGQLNNLKNSLSEYKSENDKDSTRIESLVSSSISGLKSEIQTQITECKNVASAENTKLNEKLHRQEIEIKDLVHEVKQKDSRRDGKLEWVWVVLFALIAAAIQMWVKKQ